MHDETSPTPIHLSPLPGGDEGGGGRRSEPALATEWAGGAHPNYLLRAHSLPTAQFSSPPFQGGD